MITVKIARAFSYNNTGGNPAGIVIDADELTHQQKQKIAYDMQLSEVAFILRSEKADFKLEFFTPNRQIPYCGHATIATFSYLKQNGFIKSDQSSNETPDSVKAIYFKEGKAYMEQASPVFKNVNSRETEEIIEALHINKTDLLNHPLQIVNTGNSFLIVPIKNEKILQSVHADLEKVSLFSDKQNLIGFYLFTPLSGEQSLATTRMFAPAYGIAEEAATGMAAGPLGCYLFAHQFINNSKFTIKQGMFMPQPSPSLLDIELHVENNEIKRLWVGGHFYIEDEVFVPIE